MDNKICNRLIDDMFDEMEGIEEYRDLMLHYQESEDHSHAKVFKEMALEEFKHFETIHGIIGDMLSSEEKTNPGCFKILHERYACKYKHIKEELSK